MDESVLEYPVTDGLLRWSFCKTIRVKANTAPSGFPENGMAAAFSGYTAWNTLSRFYKFEATTTAPYDGEIYALSSNWGHTSLAAGSTARATSSDGKTIVAFRTDLNAYEYDPSWWSTSCWYPYVHIYSVAVHEAGHALGLLHITGPGSNCDTVMKEWFWDCDCYSSTGTMDAAAIVDVYDDQAADAGVTDCCTNEQRLAVVTGAAASDGCAGGHPDAAIEAFKLVDRLASWSTVFENNTSAYFVETSPSPDGPWSTVGSEHSGIGEHEVPVAPVPGHRFARLLEVESDGRQLIQGQDRIWTTEEVAEARNSKRRFDAPRRGLSVGAAATTGCTDWAASPNYVIFAAGSLFSVVDCTIASLRQTQGWSVRAIDVDASAPGSVSDFIATTIQDYHAQFGTKYFQIVGSWVDEFSSELWEASDYWKAKKAAFVEHRANSDKRDALGAVIPPILVPVHGAVPTAASTPYAYSDQPYGDLDDDGIPDVVVTRWPFTTASQVQAAYYNLAEYSSFPAPARTLFLGYDTAFYWNPPDVVPYAVEDDAERLESLDPSQTVATLFSSTVTGTRTLVTADTLNSQKPDVVFLYGTVSSSHAPANWFSKESVVPWEMSLLEPFNYSRLIVAASCDAADYEDYTSYGAPSCVDFLSTAYQGTMGWIGPTGNSENEANYLITVRLMEELYGNPYRSMAESWLVAMQRAYADVAVSSDFDDLLPTLQSYVFLGDPILPLAALPTSTLTAYARKMPGGAMLEMPGDFAVGCPGRDADQIVVEVKLNAPQVVGGSVSATDLTLGQPTAGEPVFFPDDQVITADSAAVLLAPESGFPSGCYKTTFTVSAIGGCGIDSAQVFLEGVPLGYAHFNVKSPDMILASGTRGLVDVPDFTAWAVSSTSSMCDCIYENSYSSCADFVPPDTAVSGADFTFFGAHFNHGDPSGLGNPTVAQASTSAGSVHLAFAEEQVLTGPHRLRVQISLDGVEPLQAMIVALAADNPRLTFLDWSPNQDFSGRTMCTTVDRDGGKQLFLGVVGTKAGLSANGVLGTAVFSVSSDDELSLTDADFALVTADVMSSSGSIMQVPTNRRQMTYSPPTYRNELAQNYPNPFNPRTTISFSLADASDAELRIFDVRGAVVRTLVNGRQQAGVHRVDWDGLDNRGQRVASGIYFYKLNAGSFSDTKKMTILK